MKENIAKSKLGFIGLLAAQPPIPSPGGRYAPTALKQSDKLHFAHWRKNHTAAGKPAAVWRGMSK